MEDIRMHDNAYVRVCMCMCAVSSGGTQRCAVLAPLFFKEEKLAKYDLKLFYFA
jgi:hypothetical protein